MPEPLVTNDQDPEDTQKPEARAARPDGTPSTQVAGAARMSPANTHSDEAQAASEPMDLERLPDAKSPPPGRQRTGDPPATP